MNSKKNYERPLLDITALLAADVITTSGAVEVPEEEPDKSADLPWDF